MVTKAMRGPLVVRMCSIETTFLASVASAFSPDGVCFDDPYIQGRVRNAIHAQGRDGAAHIANSRKLAMSGSMPRPGLSVSVMAPSTTGGSGAPSASRNRFSLESIST